MKNAIIQRNEFLFKEKGDDLPRSPSTIHRPADVGSHIVTVFLKFLKKK